MKRIRNILLILLLLIQGITVTFSFWIQDYFYLIMNKLWLVNAVGVVNLLALFYLIFYNILSGRKMRNSDKNSKDEIFGLKAKLFDMEEKLREVKSKLEPYEDPKDDNPLNQ